MDEDCLKRFIEHKDPYAYLVNPKEQKIFNFILGTFLTAGIVYSTYVFCSLFNLEDKLIGKNEVQDSKIEEIVSNTILDEPDWIKYKTEEDYISSMTSIPKR